MSRINSSIINLLTAFIGQFIGLIISYITRIFFIHILGAAYLGINGLFTNILTMLSLVELGVGPAMVFSLYQPLAERDHGKLKSLMRLYRRAYIAIGCAITTLGVAVFPFLQYFMKEVPNIDHIQLIFLLFVFNSSISYFFSYKRSLIIADQHRYIATCYRYVFYFIVNVTQIIFLLLTKNFIVYLLLQLLGTFLENISISRKANLMYPYLREGNVSPIDCETMSTIKKNIAAMVCHKIGGIVVTATDNLLISRLIGVLEVGFYSNYQLILNALNSIIGQFGNAILASVGNLGATENKEYVQIVFYRINFLYAWVFGFSSICLFCLLQPFISFSFGSNLLLPTSVMALLVLNFYLTGMRRSTLLFRDALGMYWYDRYKPLVESAINLVASIFLGQKIGISGIFLGTTISTLTTCFWVEPLVLYRHGFHAPLSDFFKRYAVYTTVTLAALAVTSGLCRLLPDIGLGAFTVKLIICCIIPNAIFLLCYLRTEELSYYRVLLQSMVRKLMERRGEGT